MTYKTRKTLLIQYSDKTEKVVKDVTGITIENGFFYTIHFILDYMEHTLKIPLTALLEVKQI